MRATHAGLLDGVDGRDRPPEGENLKEGGFSFVVDNAAGRIRQLPSLYVNDVQLFADRDVDRVRDLLVHVVDAFMRSGERATYMLTACEIGGRRGLYGSTFFNRATTRRDLARLGMTFSDDPFTVFGADGTFASADRSPFTPEFVTFPLEPGGARVTRWTPAALLHRTAFYRIADIAEDEVARLAAALAGCAGLSARTAPDLAAAVGEL